MRGLLIDLDGTLLDSVGPSAAVESWAVAARECAPEIAAQLSITPAEAAACLSETARQFWRDPERHRWGRMHPEEQRQLVVRQALAAWGVDAPDLVQVLSDRYWREKQRRFQVFPLAVQALAQLRSMDLALVLVTNGDAAGQREKIDRFDLARWFDAILIEGEQGVGKPEPEMYRRALAAANLTPWDAMMIGDHLEWEIAAPARLGLASIWVNTLGASPGEDARATPFAVVRQFHEVPGWVGQWIGGEPAPSGPADIPRASATVSASHER